MHTIKYHREALDFLINMDPKLRPVIESTDIPVLEVSDNVYFDLIESIVSQQISILAARSIFGRFCALFPNNYPEPKTILETPLENLRAAGLSGQKANYIRNIAEYALLNNFEDQKWDKMSDEDILQFLTPIKGVGIWTVQMVLIFTLGRPDVLPTADLGISQAFSKIYGIEGNPSTMKKNMELIAEKWRPHRSLVCRYLWKWNDIRTKSNK